MMKDRTSGHGFDIALIAIFGVAVHSFYLSVAPVFFHNDSVGYLHAAFTFLGTGSLDGLEGVRTPGYPLFLSAILALFGFSATTILLAQHALIVFLAAIVTSVSRRIGPRSVSLAAGMFVAVDPVLAFYGNWILSEVLFAFIITLAGAATMQSREGAPTAGAAGFLFGIAALVRPAGLVAAAASVAVLLLQTIFRRTPFKSGVLAVLVFAVGLAISTAPWLIYRYSTTGTWTFIDSNSGFLQVQMLLHHGDFDEQLIADPLAKEAYEQTVVDRLVTPEGERPYQPGFAFQFQKHLQAAFGNAGASQWFDDYFSRYQDAHADKLASQRLSTFLGLLHLGPLPPFTPEAANAQLDGVLSKETLARSITSDARIRAFLLKRPEPHAPAARRWKLMLHYLHQWRPALAITLYVLTLLAGIRVLFSRNGNLLLFTPIAIFLSQAAAYAWLLHPDDRYVYVLNPLLVLQGGVALSILLDRAARWRLSHDNAGER
ncbi:MAG: glycosyltransferase family 39 protein [Bdellovibrionales bacterium]|nr:glycosyltransferase family 39 protein [Bdellovibrionales bacterium]